ncbi:MAG: tRNA (N6-isopentenyl adenosine(37)-C2)-methylthiotransferase MiaB, partial [Oscillospiraceae bacterium]|nr:tRNA (N6-isopentenyl adenosine(37)-C2)-methylthiotransferase MiaB [Oscillospiraceae bacterium]
MQEIKNWLSQRPEPPKAYLHAFGCQLNVADGENLSGILQAMGYIMTDDVKQASLILYHTCAVRENAEDRVFGTLGSIKKLKQENPALIICVTGCMTAQKQVADKIAKSYRYVDIVLGTSAVNRLAQMLYAHMHGLRYAQDIETVIDIPENLEPLRESKFKASVPIMYGCNNFCTYCIVPYVRGRERSRKPENIVSEVKKLIQDGYKEIMLLGQNVNSYGKDLDIKITFPELLRELNKISGEYWIRFMSSHPKDATPELMDCILECEHVAKHLHLPVQSGSNEILKRMNRNYTVEKYLSQVNYIREKNPDFSLTTDLIIGFPDESEQDFQATLALVKQVKYDNMYSFIYSKRTGTKAASMPDSISDSEKSQRMQELLAVQREISVENMLIRSLRFQRDKHASEHPTLEQVIAYSFQKLSSKY